MAYASSTNKDLQPEIIHIFDGENCDFWMLIKD